MGIASHPITKALAGLNAARGLAYPERGYSYFADVKGDGASRPSVWVIIGDAGGVTWSPLNDLSRAETLANIAAATQTAPAYVKGRRAALHCRRQYARRGIIVAAVNPYKGAANRAAWESAFRLHYSSKGV